MKEPYLNEKIAKWCGFTYGKQFKYHYDWNNKETTWIPPSNDITQHQSLPDFTESMDAILKWVVPKLTDYAIEWHGKDMHRVSIQTILDGDLFYQCDNKSMSMAFCLALEKYIDAQETK